VVTEVLPKRSVLFIGGARHGTTVDTDQPAGMLPPYVDIATGSTYYPEVAAFVTTHPATGRPQTRYRVEVYAHEGLREPSYACMQCQQHVPPNHADTVQGVGHTVVMTPKEQHLMNGLQDAVLRRFFLDHGKAEPYREPPKRINGSPSGLILPGDAA
jgi:hypothetical protein